MGRLVLVTGGGGFIGSNIVDGLLDTGCYEVRILDNFSTGMRQNIAHISHDVELIEGDIRDLETVEKAVRGVDTILHQAALPSVARSVEAPRTTDQVNVGGTLNVLSAAHKAGVRRVVFASSSSVYGDSRTLPKHEELPTSPMSPYAVSKLAGEHYVRVFHTIYGMETVSLRYFNVFGPRQDPTSQYSGVIAKFISCALRGEKYHVFGDGLQARDFSYVENVVQANLRAVEASGICGQALNIACGAKTTLLEMIDKLNELVDSRIDTVREPERAGDVRESQAAIDAAAEAIGYAPTVDFPTGLHRTLEWYRESEGAHFFRQA